MRVLWVSAEPPDFQRCGGSMRQAHLLSGLSRQFGEVDLLLVGALTDDRVRSGLGTVVELPAPRRRLARTRTGRRLRDLWRVGGARLPAEVYDRRAERAAIWDALEGIRPASAPGSLRLPYDLVHVEHLGLAGVVPVRALEPGGLRSLGVQNVPSRMAAQAAALGAGRRQRWLARAESRTAFRFERRALGYADVVTVVSPEDGAELMAGGQERGRVSVPPAEMRSPLGVFAPAPRGNPVAREEKGPALLVAPNGVDCARWEVSPPPPGPGLVFTGTLDYLPNVDGIAWFVDEVMPLLRQEMPEARLEVVGRSPAPELARLAEVPGVEVSADVEEVAPHLGAARVAVVPLRIGTGSRLKILEAMAAGRPVVSTTVGAEGLAAEPGRHLLVADDPREMAAAIVLLARDDSLAAGLAAEARRLVEERYDWPAIADRWATELAALVRSRRPG